MEQSIYKNDNFDSYNIEDHLQVHDHNHQVSWKSSTVGHSFLGVSKTWAAPTVSITAKEEYFVQSEKRNCGRSISREVRLELNLDSAKALRDLLNQIIEKEAV